MFGRNLVDFWCQNGGKLAPKWDQKLMFTWDGDFSKIVLQLQRGLDFSGSGDLSWEQTSIKNLSKVGIQDSIILASIFERFCWILGTKLKRKIDQKSIKKTMQKTKPFGTRLGPSSGCQGGHDVLRPNPTGPGGTKIVSWRPPGPPHFAQKYQLKKRQS